MATAAGRVHIVGDWDGTGVKKASQDIGAFEKQATGFSDSITKSFGGMGAKLGGALAIGAVGAGLLSFLQDSMAAAIQDEKSMVALATAMGNVNMQGAVPGAEALIKKMSMLYGIADDDLRPAFQKLVTVTKDVAKAQELLQLSADLSAAGYGDLTSTSKALSAAAAGNFTALSRLKLPLDQNLIKTKDLGGAISALNQLVGGQASAAAATYGGKLARITVAAEEAKETIGYALLNAVDSASQSFGGTGGLVSAIDNAGTKAANLVTGIGAMVSKLGELNNATKTSSSDSGLLASNWDRIWAVWESSPMGGPIKMLGELGKAGAEAAAEQAVLARSVSASEDLYKGYTATLDANAAAGVVAKDAQAQLAVQFDAAAAAADKVYAATVRSTDALKAYNAAISASGAMDKYKADLLEIAALTDKSSKSLSDNSTAGLDNRDKLRGYFTDTIAAATAAGKLRGDTDTQIVQSNAKMLGDMRNDLIAKGFKAADINKFMGGTGLWNMSMRLMFEGMARGDAAAAARYSGMALGKNLALGVVAGLQSQTDAVRAAAGMTMADAAAAARYTAQESSPSKVWAEIGSQLTAGLVQGMKKDAGSVTAASKSIVEAANNALAAEVDKAKEALATAKAAFADFKATVSDAIMGGIDFSAAAPQMDEAGNRVGKSFIDALTEQANNAKNFALQVGQLITMGLSKESLTLVLQAGVQAGTAIAGELITGGATAIATTNELVASTQSAADAVGLQAATNWYGAGVTSAQQTYLGFRDAMGKDGPVYNAMMNVMDNMASAMNRTATIEVTTINRSVNIVSQQVGNIFRAAGGPVAGGMPYIVGEKGPEMFVPSVSGSIVPNGSSSRSGMGNSYAINVSAGVGDPRAIGQQVVEYIKRFEAANGKVWKAA